MLPMEVGEMPIKPNHKATMSQWPSLASCYDGAVSVRKALLHSK